MSAISLYKNDVFVGIFPGDKALAHIHQGDKNFTVAQAVAEGWTMRFKPRQKEKTNG